MPRDVAENSAFWRDTLEHQLLSVEHLNRCLADIPEEKQTPEKIDNRLARLAIHHGYMTLWQAQRVLTRRASSLFIEKYLLLDTLGQGGMGRVFLARDRRLNRLVAIKVLNPDRANQQRSLARFEREAQVGGQLQHENLVRIYDVGLFNQSPYLVMEYIEGLTVADLITRQGRLSPAQAARIGRDVALGLQHLAEKKMVHRDVNPRNILIDKEGRAKLTDLGLAIFEEQEAQVTNEGSTVGTFDYISPEQARHSHGVDIRSDIYSLGCSLYHMLCGQVPFPAGSLAEKIYSHQVRDPEPLGKLVSDLPPEMSKVVQKCMRKKPEDRFESARTLADRLSPWVPAEPVPLPIDLSRTGSFEMPSSNVPLPTGSMQAAAAADEAEIVTDRERSWHGEEPPAGPQNSKVSDPDAIRIDLGADSLELPRRLEMSRKSVDGSVSGDRRVRLHRAFVMATCSVLLSLIAWQLVKPKQPPATTKEPQHVTTKPDKPVGEPENKPQADKAIIVRFADGQEQGFSDLAEAVRRVNGQQAEILLENHETPWVWAIQDNAPIAGTKLHIRGRGVELPRVVLDLAKSTKGLQVRADSRLELTGLQMESRNQPARTPLVQAFGDLEVDRCRWLHREPKDEQVVALRLNLKRFQMRDSWIHGFGTAIDAQFLPDSQVELDNCLITAHAPSAGAAPAKKKNKRDEPPLVGLELPKISLDRARLRLNHVTMVGQSLIELRGDTENRTVAVEASRCLFRGATLVSVKQNAVARRAVLNWLGDHNLYDLSINFTPNLMDGQAAAGLKDWANVLKESDSQQRKVLLSNQSSLTPTPADFVPRQKADQEFGYR